MVESDDGAGIVAVALSELRPSRSVQGWSSGWLGISAYGHDTHGFATLSLNEGGDVEAGIDWVAPNGEVYSPFRLRYDPTIGAVTLLANFGEEGSAVDEDEDEDEDEEESAVEADSAWSVEGSAVVAEDLTRLWVEPDGSYPEELFTRLAVAHAGMFEVLTLEETAALWWDHHWMPGPGRTDAWRPVDLGQGLAPFRVRPVPEVEPSPSEPPRVHRATGPAGPGLLADIGVMQVFVDDQATTWVPVVAPDQLADYQLGEQVDLKKVQEPARTYLQSKIAFLLGPRPMS